MTSRAKKMLRRWMTIYRRWSLKIENGSNGRIVAQTSNLLLKQAPFGRGVTTFSQSLSSFNKLQAHQPERQ